MSNTDLDKGAKYRLLLETPRERWDLTAKDETELTKLACARTAETVKRMLFANGDNVSDAKGSRGYRLRIDTSFGSYEITADTGARLIVMASPQAAGAIAAVVGAQSVEAVRLALSRFMQASWRAAQSDADIREIAIAALAMYNGAVARQGRPRSESRITKAGLELDLLTCYLRRMTIKEIVAWFDRERQFKVSSSAVGRHTPKFWQLGIRPVVSQGRAVIAGGGQ
ncbi:MAG: hypothetical protein ACYTEL_06980 [Planctomycetota bacterium]|jgi:hypothetical protein